MSGNWIKIHRKILESDLIEDESLLILWIKILLTAQYLDKVKKVKWFGKQKELDKGCLHIVQNVWIKELKWGKSKFRRCLKYLENSDRIRTEIGPEGSIVTVCNWESYQVRDDDAEPRSDHNRTTTGPQPDQDRTTPLYRKKERKKERRKEDLQIKAPYQKILDLYHEHCKTLPSVQRLSISRKAKIELRWAENNQLEVWESVFKKFGSSSFYTGDNDRGWKADFDWFISSEDKFLRNIEKDMGGEKAQQKKDVDEKGICIFCRNGGSVNTMDGFWRCICDCGNHPACRNNEMVPEEQLEKMRNARRNV